MQCISDNNAPKKQIQDMHWHQLRHSSKIWSVITMHTKLT